MPAAGSDRLVPEPDALAAVAARVAEVRERIAAAGGRDVALVAVTKTFGPDALVAAARCGCDGIGENYAQELVGKLDALAAAGLADELPPVHFIGQLQSNKVRALAGRVAVFETVDRSSLVRELARRAPGAHVLVQVAVAAEPGKGGCPVGDVPALADACAAAGLVVDGLMTVGPTHGGPEAARPAFREVRDLADRLGLRTCSMGMSGDVEVAVQEGSTQVRIGSALFGPRPPAP